MAVRVVVDHTAQAQQAVEEQVIHLAHPRVKEIMVVQVNRARLLEVVVVVALAQRAQPVVVPETVATVYLLLFPESLPITEVAEAAAQQQQPVLED